MTGAPVIRAEGFPPGIENFNYRDWIPALPDHFLTTITFSVFLAVGILICFFLVSYRNPQLVPTKKQWIAESIYGFVRDGIARDIVGPEGIRFAPYFTTLFCFIALTNVFAIVPFIQISPNAHIAFPAVLGILSWLIYNVVGIRKHGLWGYVKMNSVPSGTPIALYPIIIPIEFVSNLILRPITLSVRLFANMFAGHMILLVFILGGVALIEAGGWFMAASPLAFIMAIVMTFFEFFIQLLQAYVFVLLTAVYVQGSLAEEH
ncbi:F-type H+-transporting ATPase subunit a [Stackebrandtia albiflava]|uniref:ATP synthase subunit a n=1 Tax=Stackebrandtia albiflava TaxID=406432 RepID=A0A562V3K4_9ACTN|nr:F0F1 ATP synthase subunit A [Stackebrandtia albiflava]TWJ12464.1 F-type H+-transporting ATPase subunit a [Stackebrandtia albiflava]